MPLHQSQTTTQVQKSSLFSVCHITLNLYLEVPDQGFLDGKAISRGNNYTYLFMKHSGFLCAGG